MATFLKNRNWRTKPRTPVTNKNAGKRFDFELFVKIIGVAFTPITILIGIHQYNQSVEREFRRNYYERQMQVYNDLIELCSKIAIINIDSFDTPSFLGLETRLNENYHGKLSLFENEEVEAKVSDFIVSMQRFKRDDVSDEIIDNDVMKHKCFLITQACRRSLAQTYNVSLRDLEFSMEDSTNKKFKAPLTVATIKEPV